MRLLATPTLPRSRCFTGNTSDVQRSESANRVKYVVAADHFASAKHPCPRSYPQTYPHPCPPRFPHGCNGLSSPDLTASARAEHHGGIEKYLFRRSYVQSAAPFMRMTLGPARREGGLSVGEWLRYGARPAGGSTTSTARFGLCRCTASPVGSRVSNPMCLCSRKKWGMKMRPVFTLVQLLPNARLPCGSLVILRSMEGGVMLRGRRIWSCAPGRLYSSSATRLT